MQWFNNLKVAYKVLLSCLVFVVIISALALLGYNLASTATSEFRIFYGERFEPVRWLNRSVRNMIQRRVNMLVINESAREGDMAEVVKRMEDAEKLAAMNDELWKKFTAIKLDDEEKKIAEAYQVKLEENRKYYKAYVDAVNAKNFKLAAEADKKWVVGFRELRDSLDKLVQLQDNEAKKMLEDTEASGRRTSIMLLVVWLLSLGISVVITTILARSVSNPVRKGLEFAKKIAEGDLTDRIDLDQNDELGQLAKALNVSAESLEKFVSEVLVASQNLSQAVEEIASGNQNLSQRTSEQASSLEEIASTIEETTATIRQNAENSNEANKLSIETMRMAEEGNSVVVDAVASINEVNKSSKKIEEIISVINEIAFQTNLLALNAAVEAARAGEQGRGFAVVAGEVRNLAQRSGNAAKEIGTLIKESMDKIETGTDLANRSGDAIREIVNSMKNVARLVSEIAAANQEQKQGIDQINIAVSEMDTMTQQNAALVEETASASEEMAGQAKEMQAMVERFRITDTTRDKTFSSRHKEVHLKAAEAQKKKPAGKPAANGERKPQKQEDPAAERRKPVDVHKPVEPFSVKDSLKDEGFEEF